jgi:hypothetical protein
VTIYFDKPNANPWVSIFEGNVQQGSATATAGFGAASSTPAMG